MANTAHPTPAGTGTWFFLVVLATAALLLAMLTPEQTASSAGHSAGAWSTVPVLWLLFAVPAAVLLHGHAFSTPRNHSAARDATLRAARSVWGVLALGVVLSLVTARLSGAVSPSAWPGAVMLMLLVLARPGRAV